MPGESRRASWRGGRHRKARRHFLGEGWGGETGAGGSHAKTLVLESAQEGATRVRGGHCGSCYGSKDPVWGTGEGGQTVPPVPPRTSRPGRGRAHCF